jgi:hypothetical protein
MPNAILIGIESMEVVELAPDRDGGPLLRQLQELVGGLIEALPIPDFVTDADRATAYVNEEGKMVGLPVNWAATDFMVPGVGLAFGDVIAGPMLLAGFDPRTGTHRDLPPGVAKRARLIASERGDS